jgi:GTP-binding protein EngB required for normal cell division
MLPREAELARLAARLRAASPAPLADTPALRALLAALDRALRSVRDLEANRIVVGLLGGTGVGKSALLNALAGAEVSASGERRPTTDRIVCHRHEADPAPDWLAPEDLAGGTPPHRAEALRGVVLLDLPDVDGWKEEHRARTWRAIPRLDLLLVVSSVEKYGDRVLYDELRALPQAGRNRVFVLNKADLVDDAARALLVADFARKLALHGEAADPRLFAVSALTERRGADGGLAPLRALLAELGGVAPRRAVLEANAGRAVADAARALDAALPRAPIARAHDDLSATLDPLASAGPRERARLAQDLEAELSGWLRATAREASSFPIGWIGYWTARLGRRGAPPPPAAPSARPPGVAADHADALLWRPLALARKRAEEALRRSGGVLALELPAAPERAGGCEAEAASRGPAAAAWEEGLARRARRRGWRLPQHALPAVALALFGAWLAAAVRAAPAGTSLPSALLAALATGAAAATLSGVASALALLLAWYGLAYSYFVYRVAKGVHEEAGRGADAHLEDFAAAWDALWREPMRAQGASLAALVADLEAARRMLET